MIIINDNIKTFLVEQFNFFIMRQEEYDENDQEYCDEDEEQYWDDWADALDDLDEGGDGEPYF